MGDNNEKLYAQRECDELNQAIESFTQHAEALKAAEIRLNGLVDAEIAQLSQNGDIEGLEALAHSMPERYTGRARIYEVILRLDHYR